MCGESEINVKVLVTKYLFGLANYRVGEFGVEFADGSKTVRRWLNQ
jgi:hypothetical protein